MIAAYARVSTDSQNLARQTSLFDEVLGQDSYQLFTDKGISGASVLRERPAGSRLWDLVEAGTITEVHFQSVDRCGRQVSDICSTLHELADRGVQVVVHDQGLRLLTQDGKLNPTASLLLNCLASISQIERQLIVDRTKAGVAAARAAGKYIGRKPGSVESDQRFLQKPKVKAIIPLLDEDYPVKYIAKIVGCSPQLVRKVRTRLEAKS